MTRPTANLSLWRPVARPAFGLMRLPELIFGLGLMPMLETMYLYWAPDHLLIARRAGTTDRYQRLYYADIQGIRLQRSNQHLLASIGLLVIGGFFGYIAFSYWTEVLNTVNEWPGFVIAVVIATVAIVLMVGNLLRGPLCRCEIVTAVDIVRIHGIARWAAGMRFADELARRVREAQGPLPESGESPPRIETYQKPLRRTR